MNAPWITDHQKITVLDCTIRDGGLVNDHQFDDSFVRAVYDCCVEAGVDCMEIGYKNSDKFFSRDKMGAWRFCNEDDMRRVVGDNPSSLRLACMADAGKSNWKEDIISKDKSVLDIIRVAFYAHQIDEAMDMIKDAYDKGYEVSANLMAVSTVAETEVDKVLERLMTSPAAVIVVVDSYGSMVPEQTEYLTKKYVKFASEVGKEVGIHAHNNQQLAFANTIEAVRHGAFRVDASIGGLGRGAGNCPMELLLSYLKNPKAKIRPVYQCLENYFVALRQKIEWGPYPEFNITGQLNQHPRTAIAAREGADKDKYVEFFDAAVKAAEQK